MQPFEFVIPSRPVSQQTRRRDRLHIWKEYVRSLAVASWTPINSRPLGTASLTLLYLYEEAALDLDNIVKPIQDALVGVALDDDALVSDIVIRRRSLRTTFRLDGLTPVLTAAFDRGGEFVYVKIEDAPAQEDLL